MPFFTNVYDEWQNTRKINQLWQRNDFVTQHLREAVGQAQIGASGDFSQVTAAISQSQIATPQLTKIVANPPTTSAARAINSSAQLIPNNVSTAVHFDTTVFDTGMYHSTTINNTRLTIISSGIYLFTACVTWAAAAATDRVIEFQINGNAAKVFAGEYQLGATARNTNQSLASMVNLSTNDYVEVLVYQNSGGAINILPTANYLPCFTVEKIQ